MSCQGEYVRDNKDGFGVFTWAAVTQLDPSTKRAMAAAAVLIAVVVVLAVFFWRYFFVEC